MSHAITTASPTKADSVFSTAPAVTTTAATSRTMHQGIDQDTLNIIFGIFAIVLALVAIAIGWLQLRSFKRNSKDEEDRNRPATI